MTWAQDFRAGHVKFQDSTHSGTPAYVYGITNMRYSLTSSVRKDRGSGSVYTDSAALDQASPMISFTTHDILNAITNFGITGKCVTGDVDDPGVVFYAQKYSCAGASSSADNRTYTVKTGVVVPRTLTIDHQGNAQITYECYAAWDGTNDPVTVATTASVPTYVPSFRYTMQKMSMNGATTYLEGKRSISIDFGSTVTHEAADGDRYPTVTTLSSMMPRVTVRGVDPEWLEDHVDMDGTTVARATSVISLLRRGSAVGESVHVKLAVNGLATWDTPIDAGIDGPGECTLSIDCTFDGTNAPITATTLTTLS